MNENSEYFFFEVPDTVRDALMQIAGPAAATISEAIAVIHGRLDRASQSATAELSRMGDGIIRRARVQITLWDVLQDIVEHRHMVVDEADVLVYPADAYIPDFDILYPPFGMPFQMHTKALPAYLVYNGRVYRFDAVTQIKIPQYQPLAMLTKDQLITMTTSSVSITVRELHTALPLPGPFDWFEGVRRTVYHMKEMIDRGDAQTVMPPPPNKEAAFQQWLDEE